jgi:acyl dehydratase
LNSASAKHRSFSSIVEGEQVRLPFAVTDGDMAAFAAISGDRNPLHCNDAFAQSRGFPGRVVYGALLVAKVSKLIGMELPGRDAIWSSLDIQFASPLLVGQPAVIEASVAHISAAASSLELKLRIHADGKLIARGKALVAVHTDG